MDEARYIDWYDVVQAVANGRSDGHACPECGASGLESSADGVTVRVRCPACGQGFSGRLAHGRDDALHAEAAALVERGRRGDRAARLSAPRPIAPRSSRADSARPAPRSAKWR
jgi:ribosomal protein L37AE/L43A